MESVYVMVYGLRIMISVLWVMASEYGVWVIGCCVIYYGLCGVVMHYEVWLWIVGYGLWLCDMNYGLWVMA